MASPAAPSPPTPLSPDLKRMRVQELRDALASRGLETSGLKDSLVARLQAFLNVSTINGTPVPTAETAAETMNLTLSQEEGAEAEIEAPFNTSNMLASTKLEGEGEEEAETLTLTPKKKAGDPDVSKEAEEEEEEDEDGDDEKDGEGEEDDDGDTEAVVPQEEGKGEQPLPSKPSEEASEQPLHAKLPGEASEPPALPGKDVKAEQTRALGKNPLPNASALARASSESRAVTDYERKRRRAERFGTDWQVSESEKRTMRAKRFGLGAVTINEKEGKKSEAEMMGVRAAGFGIIDEETKKRARLERFGVKPELGCMPESEKRKARAARFGTVTDRNGAKAKGK